MKKSCWTIKITCPRRQWKILLTRFCNKLCCWNCVREKRGVKPREKLFNGQLDTIRQPKHDVSRRWKIAQVMFKHQLEQFRHHSPHPKLHGKYTTCTFSHNMHCLKIVENLHSKLRAKRATFTFWVNRTKLVENAKIRKLRCNILRNLSWLELMSWWYIFVGALLAFLSNLPWDLAIGTPQKNGWGSKLGKLEHLKGWLWNRLLSSICAFLCLPRSDWKAPSIKTFLLLPPLFSSDEFWERRRRIDGHHPYCCRQQSPKVAVCTGLQTCSSSSLRSPEQNIIILLSFDVNQFSILD